MVPRPFHDSGRVRQLDSRPPLDQRDLEVFARLGAVRQPMEVYATQVAMAVLVQSIVRGWLARRRAQAVRAARARRPRTVRPGFVRIFLLMAMFAGVAGTERDVVSRHEASITYVRTDLFTGLASELADRVDVIMDNRLAASSMRTVQTALKYWEELRREEGWSPLIYTDELERGAKLVSFVLRMLDDTELVFSSIQSYVWGLRWHMKLQRQADPVMGVLGWPDFMSAVKVLSWVPHEPRRALPLALILKMAATIDTTVFWEVQFMFFLLILLFTFSRSECPCPKHFTGEESWDDDKHWMVRDIVMRKVEGLWAIAVRFKSVKQDPRIERPTARGDGTERGASQMGGSDWSYIGDVPGSELSIFKWHKLYTSFFDGVREPTAPFFLDKDMRRPYTYTTANKDLKTVLARVTDDLDFGFHGARVEGYNLSKQGNGVDLTVAHGLWMSNAHSRYERWRMFQVLGISAGMLGAQSTYKPQEVREVQRGIVRRGIAAVTPHARARVVPVDGGSEGSPSPPPAMALPPGWQSIVVRSAAGALTQYQPPPGMAGAEIQPSVAAAWRVHNERARLTADLPPDFAPSFFEGTGRARTRGGLQL